MEEMLDRLSLILSSSQGSPFCSFNTPASQVDGFQLGLSGVMQRLGWVGPADAVSLEVKVVLVSSLSPTGGFHAPVPGIGKVVHSALGTFRTVYGGVVGDSHLAPLPGSCPTTQDTEVNLCHTAFAFGGQTHIQDIDGGICYTLAMPGGQTPFQDVEAGICHTAPMPGSQLIIPSRGLGLGETIPFSSVVEFG
ncbi:hypothetical protein E2C01_065365 [Portunus trituberculatus]|uniref:Uncharacterized protein n=1 Tax=Portunus trituberculatus TaxID=210409 RepID=A0A5B7HMD9_PORTR|nr:hypothetical protein [Portunus trituberculatus]